jgi:hypothetical protein
MAKDNVHVIPRGDGWAVRRDSAKRDSFHLRTQAEAEMRARRIAARERVEVIIHRADGAIRDSDSHGRDPNPPRDTVH